MVRSGPDRLFYLLLKNPRHGWGLPKGHAAEGEDLTATARRETEEETGISADALRICPRFSREIRYEVKKGLKRVTYLLARTEREEIALSSEHDEARWVDLDGALDLIEHKKLRAVVRAGATFLRDPMLRRGLSPEAARALLLRYFGEDAPVVAHSAQVASIARTIADLWDGVDADYVEACAWLHDIGRRKTQGPDHTLAGFHIVVEEGWPGYAPPCLSHFAKGAPIEALLSDPGADPTLIESMYSACDLDTLPTEEKIIALADFHVAGPRRVTLDERRADLERRYGPSPLITRNHALAHSLSTEAQSAIGALVEQVIGLS